MEDDRRRIYELETLVEAQKTKIKKLGNQVKVAHRQRVKSIPTKTLLWVLARRVRERITRYVKSIQI